MSAFYFEAHAARKYGVNVAIILEALKFLLRKNKANHQNLYDGRFWIRNSGVAWAELFPFWSEDQVVRYLEKARECSAVAIGNYNKSPLDRTLWYTIIDPEIFDSTDLSRSTHTR